MAKFLFANNATSRLRIATPAASPTITVASGEGARFPEPTGDDFFMVTLDDRRSGQIEIMKCTSRSGDALTVLRAQEGTTAQDFVAGALLSNRVTAGTMDAFLEEAAALAGYTKPEADAMFVDIAGDTMTGPLALPGDPTLDPHAATKHYVDVGLAGSAPLAHTHTIPQVTGLQNELNIRPTEAPNDGKPYARFNLGWADISALSNPPWTSITGKPSEFPPSPHHHPISDVDDLQNQLNLRLTDAPSDGVTYGRKNAAWTPAAGAAKIDDNAPVGADVATFWWDSNKGDLYINYFDGDTTQWVMTSAAGPPGPAGMQGPPGPAGSSGGVATAVGEEPPDNPEQGHLWWESDRGNLNIWYDDGTSAQWVPAMVGPQAPVTTGAQWQRLTQREYDNLSEKDENMLYVVVG